MLAVSSGPSGVCLCHTCRLTHSPASVCHECCSLTSSLVPIQFAVRRVFFGREAGVSSSGCDTLANHEYAEQK